MQRLPVGEQFGDVLGAEAVAAVADIVADQDLAMFAQDRFGILPPQAADHVTHLGPVLRAVVGNRHGVVDADAVGRHFFVKEPGEQGFRVELEQFGGLDRGGQLGDARPAVGVVLVGLRHLLQEEADGGLPVGGQEETGGLLLRLLQQYAQPWGKLLAWNLTRW